MKNLILSFLIAISSIASAKPHTKPDSVYICTGRYSKVYHSSRYCKGLRNCRSEIIKVSIYDATHKYGRRACEICE